MRRGRQSLCPSTILQERNRISGRSSSPSLSKRRASFGGQRGLAPSFDVDNVSVNSNEPKKDRRTMLEEWRAEIRAKESGTKSTINKENDVNSSYSAEHVSHTAPVSASSTSAFSNNTPLPLPPNTEGMTALERFRLKKQMRQKMQADSSSVNTAPTVAESTASSICFDDDTPSSSIGIRAGFTPISNRRKSVLSGAVRRTGSRAGRASIGIGGLSSSRGLDAPSTTTRSAIPPLPLPTATPSTNTANDTFNSMEGMDLLEDIVNEDQQPGQRSRLVLMEKRVQELEKEKMKLSMDKAPLEARLRQKEDELYKLRVKFDEEISELRSSAYGDSEKFKSLENQKEELQEENRRLRLEIRKQTLGSAEGQSAATDDWSRRVQNDRILQEYKEKLKNAEEEIKSLRLEKVSIESEIDATNMELSALTRAFEEMEEEYNMLRADKEANGEAEIQLEELTKEHTAMLAQLNATAGELASLQTQSKFDMEQKEREWQEEREKMLFEMSVLKSRAASNEDRDDASTDSEDEAVLRARIEEKDRRIEQLESEILKGEQIRRDLHNTIQELRGNIRVFVRTRPFLPGDIGSTQSSLDFHPDGENLAIENRSKSYDFKFDKVFTPSSGQETIFEEVSEFVQSALDGYHVCLFSYGQTGSGKTHTMQGSGSGTMRGIIPRAVEQILSQAKAMQKQKWKFNMTASFLEIYNEELKDLLVNMNEGTITGGPGMSTRNQSKDQSKLSIRRERDGRSYVAGLKKIAIDTEDSEIGMQCLKNVMSAAARARSVASTKMNSVSSRSHSVFMLHLNGVNEDDGTIVEGALNLCDLAGSERLDRSGAGSDTKRLKETQAINKSLSCLGDVFTALSNGSSHVPFRNSKLTYLLQDCLSGDGKALMFVNLSPTIESSSESLCSLRFAKRVNQVELGKATKHVSYKK